MGKPIEAALVDGGALYQAEQKVYPRGVKGRFQRLRVLAAWLLLGIYYVFPWLPWDGRQAVLFDLPARRFYVFGLNFWPQDFYLLALLLIAAGLALFFFTAVAGRLWCGYACPQTVWTEVFLWIERRFEGDRNRRIKLDRAPWSRGKLLRKGGKHLAWLVLALWTGFTFVGFFTPIHALAARLVPFQWGGWETFWVLFYAFATWGNAGFLREQVCKYMCPYARFQGAMFDRDTLVIAYDAARGEPRGPRRRGGLDDLVEAAGRSLGDCIDCTICVQVCPTGIDIRDGLQYECIACGACIDACDGVMDRMGYPRGLVRYTTERSLQGQQGRLLRGRVWIYGALLLAVLGGFAWGVAGRNPLIVDVLRDRNALYREAADGMVENTYSLRIVNKAQEAHRYTIHVEGNPAIRLATGPEVVLAGPEEVLTVAVTLRAAAAAAPGRNDIRFVVEAGDGSGIRHAADTRFFGPAANAGPTP